MRDSDLPHRTKIRELVLETAAKVQGILRERYKVCYLWYISMFFTRHTDIGRQGIQSQISITMDSWTSAAYDPYLAITAHYIDSPPDQPNEWSLKSDLLGFAEIEGNHGGANQASIILSVIDRYDVRDKVRWHASTKCGVMDTYPYK